MYELRELHKEDIPKINQWRNDNELINLLGAPFRYINIDVEYEWYDDYLQNRNAAIRCSIVERKSGDLIGLVSLTNINYINRSAEFHIMIGDAENRGRGIGYFATLEMLRHAFGNMNLNRVGLSVLTSNKRAMALYEKAGFKHEGVKRRAVYKNGEYKDMAMMSVLRQEFMGLHKMPGGGVGP